MPAAIGSKDSRGLSCHLGLVAQPGGISPASRAPTLDEHAAVAHAQRVAGWICYMILDRYMRD